MEHDESYPASSQCCLPACFSGVQRGDDERGHLAIVLPTQYARGCSLCMTKGAGWPTEWPRCPQSYPYSPSAGYTEPACGVHLTQSLWWTPPYIYGGLFTEAVGKAPAAAVAESLQSCLTLCDPTDGSPPGSPVPGKGTYTWLNTRFSKLRLHSCAPCARRYPKHFADTRVEWILSTKLQGDSATLPRWGNQGTKRKDGKMQMKRDQRDTACLLRWSAARVLESGYLGAVHPLKGDCCILSCRRLSLASRKGMLRSSGGKKHDVCSLISNGLQGPRDKANVANAYRHGIWVRSHNYSLYYSFTFFVCLKFVIIQVGKKMDLSIYTSFEACWLIRDSQPKSLNITF